MDRKVSNIFACISCRSHLDWTELLFQKFCSVCGEKYEVSDGYLRTYFDKKLFEKYRKKYLVNKVLNNNGYISYNFLPSGSLSLGDRKDVCRFRDFITNNMVGAIVCDMGCGPLARPGYLPEDGKELQIIGVDPLDADDFDGFRIVGVSELVPIRDSVVDTVIFATSLDHVCDLDATVCEVKRILKDEGKVLIWMSDRELFLVQKIVTWLKNKIKNLQKKYPVDRFVVYPNYTVLEVPRGCVDPFHSYAESPRRIEKLFIRKGFMLQEKVENGKDEIFLSFVKRLCDA